MSWKEIPWEDFDNLRRHEYILLNPPSFADLHKSLNRDQVKSAVAALNKTSKHRNQKKPKRK